MRRLESRVLFGLLCLMCLLPSAWAEQVATTPAPTAYVDDYAGVLTPEGTARIEAICTDVHEQTRAQIFLVTIHTLEGKPVETFANELFAQWKIGEKKTDRGILILLATDDHKRWIEVGYGFEGILNDAKVGDIGRAMVPDLQAERYDAAGETAVEDVAEVIAADANVTLKAPETVPVVADEPASGGSGNFGILLIWIFILVALLVFGGVFFYFASRRGLSSGSGGSGSGFVGSAPYLGSSDSSSTSGESSTSSASDSSSGSDFSGGDGGTSGGGGAGGDW